MDSQPQKVGTYMVAVHPTRINYYYDTIETNRRYKPPKDHSGNDNSTANLSIPDSCPVATLQPEQFKNNYHNGRISEIAARKINRAIDYLIYMARPKKLPDSKHGKGLFFRVNLITLTLSSEQIHTDNEISVQILRPFLNSLRQRWKNPNYIWRAERQANGSIHYHLITDRFIPWLQLRNLWNKHQQKLGYVTRYRENQLRWHSDGFRYNPDYKGKWSKEKQFNAWKEGTRTDWESPNSTDVHSIKKIKNLRAYFKKYMTKSGQSSDIAGRLWGCCEELQGLTGGRAAVYSDLDKELAILESDKSIKTFSTDYFTVIYADADTLYNLGCWTLLKLLTNYCGEKFKRLQHELPLAA